MGRNGAVARVAAHEADIVIAAVPCGSDRRMALEGPHVSKDHVVQRLHDSALTTVTIKMLCTPDPEAVGGSNAFQRQRWPEQSGGWNETWYTPPLALSTRRLICADDNDHGSRPRKLRAIVPAIVP
eukprot:7379211-Prymnesium_polylepis.1